jgi:hypothetical protein
MTSADEQTPKPGRESRRSAVDENDRSAAAGLQALPKLDIANADTLRPALAALIEVRGDRFDPVRFRFIQALADRASQLRPAVASIIEDRALRALSDYREALRSTRQQAADLVGRAASDEPHAADEVCRLFDAGDFKAVVRRSARDPAHHEDAVRVLATLTRDMQQYRDNGEADVPSSLDDALRQQELEIMRAAGGDSTFRFEGLGGPASPGGQNGFGAMQGLRQTLRQHQSEQRTTRAIREGPEAPGPLNAEALIVRSLSMMRELSPGYTHRFVSCLDTLLWLQQASKASERRKKRTSRRR